MDWMELISTQCADCGFVMNFCLVYLVKAQNHLIKSNVIRKLACKVKGYHYYEIIFFVI